jgi:hypothetical protein
MYEKDARSNDVDVKTLIQHKWVEQSIAWWCTLLRNVLKVVKHNNGAQLVNYTQIMVHKVFFDIDVFEECQWDDNMGTTYFALGS